MHRSLENLMQARRPVPLARVQDIVTDVAAVLDALERGGRMHGGLTPNHILIDDEWRTRFVAYDPFQTLTDPISVRAYHAPEQWRGETVDARADQYALAVIAYELLTAQLRLDGACLGGIQTLEDIDGFADIPLQPGAPLYVNAALRRALSVRPANRFRTSGEFARALATPPAAVPRWQEWLWRGLPPVALAAVLAAMAFVVSKTDTHAVLRWVRGHTLPAVQRAIMEVKLPK